MHPAWSLGPLLLVTAAGAQIGGDGRDGPFAPTASRTLDTARGPWFFTTINIPANVTVTVTGPNPLVLHATGAVTIAGILNADGGAATSRSGGAAGPGGYRGGDGATQAAVGQDGSGVGAGGGGTAVAPFYATSDGGGAGHSSPGLPGPLRGGRAGGLYGQPLPYDPRGGSGGGGGAATNGTGYGGGGGGGVVVIQADQGVSITGQVLARGGDVIRSDVANLEHAWGGAGSGGTIWVRSLVSLAVPAGGQLRTDGGLLVSRTPTGVFTTPSGGNGYVRIDCYGTAPTTGGTIVPLSLNTRFPQLFNVAAPRVGTRWEMACTAPAGDSVAFLLGAGSGNTAYAPYGTIALNLTLPIFVLGTVTAPADLDSWARLVLPIPNNSALANLTLYTQAFDIVNPTQRPRLSNGVTTTITN